MHIHMVAIGSTGDVRPYVLLGKELRRRGHEVTIVAFANFAASRRTSFCTSRISSL